MSRLFWFTVGAGAGVYAVRRVDRATAAVTETVAEAVSPQGLARGVTAVGGLVREFAGEVRVAMAERARELDEHPSRDRRNAP